MLLYHGSYIEVKKPKIIVTNRLHDFGFAFYLTPIKRQAEKWAKVRTNIERAGMPTVSAFEWDENLNRVNFIDVTKDDYAWLDIVVNCRKYADYVHGYDIIKGKIADDTVFNTVNAVVEGVLTKEKAIQKLKYEKVNSQVAFCTEKALLHIKYVKSYEVK